ncbi:MAG: hypothetical protein SFW67_22830 [Myxococcaceae bacterium]|nr:hypothetical protein [Myxococcaceae bacterium]
MAPSLRTCAHCERTIEPTETWYRFVLVLQGEAEVLDPRGAADEPEDLLAQLEALDPVELEAQVHEEQSGVLCTACRSELRAFLGVRFRVQ